MRRAYVRSTPAINSADSAFTRDARRDTRRASGIHFGPGPGTRAGQSLNAQLHSRPLMPSRNNKSVFNRIREPARTYLAMENVGLASIRTTGIEHETEREATERNGIR
jgi:hypothetical protein